MVNQRGQDGTDGEPERAGRNRAPPITNMSGASQSQVTDNVRHSRCAILLIAG